jgi:trk system potassium uptake protein TrkA
MKIVVAGGRDEADFLIGLLLMGKHKLITVNEDMSYCEHLAAVHDDISVIYGDPCKEYVMEDAGIRGCDIVIALREKDADNLEICQMAKRLFAVKKTVCTVRNPKNVEIFELLGVDRAISATYMLAHYIEQASVVEDLVKVGDEIETFVVRVNDQEGVVTLSKKIADMRLPFNTIISCIIRDAEVTVPNGQSKIMAGDRLVVMTTPESQKEAVKAIIGSEENEK